MRNFNPLRFPMLVVARAAEDAARRERLEASRA